MSGDEGLPEPLVPAEVDLTGYGWMPLYGHRLFGSEFNARCSDAAWRAGVTLWWAAWNQVPAASLPDDDVALCRLADLGRDVKGWRKIREDALHGFVKCSDGRLYHRVIAELALDAWDRRVRERARKERWRHGIERSRNVSGTSQMTMSETSRETGVERPTDGDGTADRTGQDRTGQKEAAQQSPTPLPREPAPAQPARAALRQENQPESPENRLIAAFDEACRAAWPEAHRAYPAATDGVIAGRLVEAGADPDLVASVASALLRRRAAKGKPCPSALAFVEGAVLEAVAERKAARPVNATAKTARGGGYTGPVLSPELRESLAKTDPDYLAALDRRQGRAP